MGQPRWHQLRDGRCQIPLFFADAKGCSEMPKIAILSAAPQHSSTGMAPGVAETMRIKGGCETPPWMNIGMGPPLLGRCGFVAFNPQRQVP